MVVEVAQQCECTWCCWTVQLHVVKIVCFILSPLKKKEKKWEKRKVSVDTYVFVRQIGINPPLAPQGLRTRLKHLPTGPQAPPCWPLWPPPSPSLPSYFLLHSGCSHSRHLQNQFDQVLIQGVPPFTKDSCSLVKARGPASGCSWPHLLICAKLTHSLPSLSLQGFCPCWFRCQKGCSPSSFSFRAQLCATSPKKPSLTPSPHLK